MGKSFSRQYTSPQYSRLPPRSFEQYCDLSRQYDPAPSPAVLPDGTIVPAYTGPPVDTFVAEFGRLDLLAYSKLDHPPDMTKLTRA